MNDPPNIAEDGVILIGNLAKAGNGLEGVAHACGLGLNGGLGKAVTVLFVGFSQNVDLDFMSGL